MLGFVLFLVIAIPVVFVLVRQVRRALYLRDAEGRRVRAGVPGLVALVVGSLLALPPFDPPPSRFRADRRPSRRASVCSSVKDMPRLSAG